VVEAISATDPGYHIPNILAVLSVRVRDWLKKLDSCLSIFLMSLL